ncbi:hypothetical protein DUT91_23170 [Phyllobacterium salinisoli]|uniref:Uncharacterized protein n=1 Tax=Phyllobacterium salinisoli TaxID=1899321 RepID=A0A368JZH4_9HYPH|nr:hypothetical protein DUT91_23170 [Phyllobacterium salinisoli]
MRGMVLGRFAFAAFCLCLTFTLPEQTTAIASGGAARSDGSGNHIKVLDHGLCCLIRRPADAQGRHRPGQSR